MTGFFPPFDAGDLVPSVADSPPATVVVGFFPPNQPVSNPRTPAELGLVADLVTLSETGPEFVGPFSSFTSSPK